MLNKLIKKIIGDDNIIPVVMFHSVGLEHTNWVYKHLSDPLSHFEDKIACLKNFGYDFIHWSDLFSYMSGTRTLTIPAVMLTFDDGYLDNWVYVYPILKKYGAKATISISPDFVDPSTQIRPNIEDVRAGRIKEDELLIAGFLNWEEMRHMEKSGLIDIQSHALTHTWYFSGTKLIDFHKPGGKKYPWMAWNARPDKKPFYMLDDQNCYVPLGTPIYEHKKALLCKKYYPPNEVASEITNIVRQKGGKNFFKFQGWEMELRQHYDILMRKYKKAITAGERSIELAPNGAMYHGLLGLTLNFAGRQDEAIKHLKQGIRLNPFPAYWYFGHLSRCYLLKRQYEDALTAAKKALHLSPDAPSNHRRLAIIYTLLNRQEEAVAATKKALELDPNFSVERAKKLYPFKNQADLKLYIGALRKAGFPEKNS